MKRHQINGVGMKQITPEKAEEYINELRAETFQKLLAAIKLREVDHSYIAKRLGKSSPYIKRVLTGKVTCSFRMMGDIARACDFRMEVDVVPIKKKNFILRAASKFKAFIKSL